MSSGTFCSIRLQYVRFYLSWLLSLLKCNLQNPHVLRRQTRHLLQYDFGFSVVNIRIPFLFLFASNETPKYYIRLHREAKGSPTLFKTTFSTSGMKIIFTLKFIGSTPLWMDLVHSLVRSLSLCIRWWNGFRIALYIHVRWKNKWKEMEWCGARRWTKI